MPDDTERKLREIFDAVAAKFGTGSPGTDSMWTKEIKKRLCSLGHEFPFDVCASGCEDADQGEWLFDLVWSEGERDEMWALPLVMESEWRVGLDDIRRDFGKLLIAKSPLKLFVFQQRTEAAVGDVFLVLRRLIRSFRMAGPGECYLLAGYSYSDRRFAYEQVVV